MLPTPASTLNIYCCPGPVQLIVLPISCVSLIVMLPIPTSASNPYCCPIDSVGQVLPIHGALSAFWCQGGQRANCSPAEPTMVTFLSNDSLHCALCTTLHCQVLERGLWNLVQIRGVPLLGLQGACPTWPRNFIEIFPPCLQRSTKTPFLLTFSFCIFYICLRF